MTFNKAKALRQAEKHVQQGKLNAAIDDYAKIAEFDSSDLTVVNTLGDLLVRAGRVEEAILNFSKIAESYRENGFTLKAIAMFKKISKLNPQNVDVSLKLAALYSQQGLLVEARQQYLQVADAYARGGKTQKALEVYQKIADLDPENTSVRIKLAETYMRENMRDQAHDAYIAAGVELIRKNRVDQGLDACLQALAINPESKPGLSAVSEAYIHQGKAVKAIELLKDAFDKNPGDVEMITILGRTYLAAGLMDEAESTFTSLVQLDKSRYEFVLEVGRTFAGLSQYDRAAEQLDACVDILISRREEDKAIDFLHSLLDRNMNHVPSLTRLADIYQRIREDHNLISTLESLVEAAVRSGQTSEAIEALKQLVRLEPENPSHRTRLQSLGVATEEISTVPTGPFAAPRAGVHDTEEDPSIARDLSDAERMARGGDMTSAILILEQVLDRAPNNVDARESLRQLYTAERMEDRAADQCIELARIHSERGDYKRAREMEDLAEALRPSSAGFGQKSPSTPPPAFELDFNEYGSPEPASDGGFSISGDFGAPAPAPADNPFELVSEFATPEPEPPPAPVSSGSLRGSGSLMTDAVLRDELEGVDFYIAQGYLEIARDTLDRLSETFPNHDDIQKRYKKLKSTAELKAQMDRIGTGEMRDQIADAEETVEKEFDLSSMFTIEPAAEAPVSTPLPPPAPAPADDAFNIRSVASPYSTSELPPQETVPAVAADIAAGFDVEPQPAAFDISFDMPPPTPPSQPLVPVVEAVVEVEEEEEFVPAAVVEKASDEDLLDDLLDNLDHKFEAIESKKAGGTATTAEMTPLPVETVEPEEEVTDGALQDIFEEFKSTFEQDTSQDFDTHYNLGIAYRDMELLDDAIEEFQAAIRTTTPAAPDGRFIQCCNMLGLSFMSKDMPRLAVMWFQKGLDAPNRPEDEYQALRFDLGLALERMGDVGKAIDVFSEVYAIDINYRDVGEKLRELQAQKKGT